MRDVVVPRDLRRARFSASRGRTAAPFFELNMSSVGIGGQHVVFVDHGRIEPIGEHLRAAGVRGAHREAVGLRQTSSAEVDRPAVGR